MAGTTTPAGTGSLYAQIAADLREKIQTGPSGRERCCRPQTDRRHLRRVPDHRQNALVRAQPGRLRPGHQRPRVRGPPQTPAPDRAGLALRHTRRGRVIPRRDAGPAPARRVPGSRARPHRGAARLGEDLVWVRCAVHSAADDPEPVQIHHSWLTGLGDDAEAALCAHDPAMSWPGAVQQVTGRTIHTVAQHTQAGGASPSRPPPSEIRDSAAVLVSHLTTHLRRRPPAHRALPIRLARRRRPDEHRIPLPRRGLPRKPAGAHGAWNRALPAHARRILGNGQISCGPGARPITSCYVRLSAARIGSTRWLLGTTPSRLLPGPIP